MAYNNGFPMSYQPQIFYPQYQMQPAQMSGANQNFQQISQTQQTQQIQNGAFVQVKSIEEARNYPVAPGNSVSFKIENAPYVCEKTQSFSQFESPIFVKYRLLREDDEPNQATPEESKTDIAAIYVKKEELKPIFEEIALLREKIAALQQEKEKTTVTPVKKIAPKKESGTNE